MADSRLAPSQWETSLQDNAVSHWLGANLESALVSIGHSEIACNNHSDDIPSMADPQWNVLCWRSMCSNIITNIALKRIAGDLMVLYQAWYCQTFVSNSHATTANPVISGRDVIKNVLLDIQAGSLRLEQKDIFTFYAFLSTLIWQR